MESLIKCLGDTVNAIIRRALKFRKLRVDLGQVIWQFPAHVFDWAHDLRTAISVPSLKL